MSKKIFTIIAMESLKVICTGIAMMVGMIIIMLGIIYIIDFLKSLNQDHLNILSNCMVIVGGLSIFSVSVYNRVKARLQKA